MTNRIQQLKTHSLLLIAFLCLAPLAVLAVQEEARSSGLVTEVRTSSFDLRTHEDGVKTFSIPGDIDEASRAAIRTGNRVQVYYQPSTESVTSQGRVIGVATLDDPAPGETAQPEPLAVPPATSRAERELDESTAAVPPATSRAARELDESAGARLTATGAESTGDPVLPKTASTLPLVPLFGLLALCAAAAIGVVTRLH